MAEENQAQQTETQPVSKPTPTPVVEPVVKPTPTPVVKKPIIKDSKKKILLIGGIFLIVLAGVGTGWLLSGSSRGGKSLAEDAKTVPGAKSGPKEAGLADEETFRDSAEGVLKKDGVNGEGTHHLEREGGESQNVYLTSTVIDLQSFVDQKVKVWGETISAKKAGWLMDVGKIKVTE